MRRISTAVGLLLCAGTMMAAGPQQRTDAPANQGVQTAVDEKGVTRQPTTEEMSRLAAMAAFKPRTAVVPVTHGTGAVSIPLDETMDHLLVVRTEADGTLEISCTDDHQDAAKFIASSASLDTIMRVGPATKVRKAQRAEKE